MSPRQEANLAIVLIRWFLRLSFGVQMGLVFAALGAYGTWAYLHNHPHVAIAPPTTSVAGSGPCADKVPYGAPRVTASPATALGELRFVCRDGYFLGHSGKTRTPLWVAEHLTSDAVGGSEPRTNEFLEDNEIPAEERALLRDYKGSGYDRGHQAPAADFSRSAKEMAESFYLSNMVPQFPENNRGPWALLEGHVRSVTRKAPDLYVVTGPGFPAEGYKTTRTGRVGIPEQLYKVAFDPKGGRMSAWLLPNADVPKDHWNDYCTSVDKVEKATGLTFYPDLPADQHAKLAQMSCAL